MEKELGRIGWGADFFSAIRPDNAGGFPSVGARGCFLSHLAVLKKAATEKHRHLIILEDDLNFVRDFSRHWSEVVGMLETREWSIFYPGPILDGLPEGLSLLSPLVGVRCTHFMMINSNAIPLLIMGLEAILSRPAGHPLGGPMHVDGAYSTIRSDNWKLNTYVYSPGLGYQRPSRTDVASLKWFDQIEGLWPAVTLLRRVKNRTRRKN